MRPPRFSNYYLIADYITLLIDSISTQALSCLTQTVKIEWKILKCKTKSASVYDLKREICWVFPTNHQCHAWNKKGTENNPLLLYNELTVCSTKCLYFCLKTLTWFSSTKCWCFCQKTLIAKNLSQCYMGIIIWCHFLPWWYLAPLGIAHSPSPETSAFIRQIAGRGLISLTLFPSQFKLKV